MKFKDIFNENNILNILEKRVNNKNISKSELIILKDFVSKQIINKKYKFIERINKTSPGYKLNSVINIELESFTSIKLSDSHNAGEITWKSNDDSITCIINPHHGFEIPYNMFDNKIQFFPTMEKEILISGKYKVIDIKIINEPFTNSSYGHKIKYYVLKEI